MYGVEGSGVFIPPRRDGEHVAVLIILIRYRELIRSGNKECVEERLSVLPCCKVQKIQPTAAGLVVWGCRKIPGCALPCEGALVPGAFGMEPRQYQR